MDPVIIVHGGAGNWEKKKDLLNRALKDCSIAAAEGKTVLLASGTALDAVEAAVRMLEDSPILDAGRGSYQNSDGQIEMDALIVDGNTLNLGAVAAVQHVLHPISLARRVMLDSNHNLLVGMGAGSFAESIGFPRCQFEDLLAEEASIESEMGDNDEESSSTTVLLPDMDYGDTVGAVAIDSSGNIAAATSTGGTPSKQAGRVGDSPLIGSGAYADNWSAGVSATGHGESLMKVVISKLVCDFVAGGLSTQMACDAAINVLEDRVSGSGGLIAIDARGNVGKAFNTSAMPHAFAIGNGEIVVDS